MRHTKEPRHKAEALSQQIDSFDCRAKLRPRGQSRSMRVPVPRPPPQHIVTIARLPPVRCSSCTALVMRIEPVPPSGWPPGVRRECRHRLAGGSFSRPPEPHGPRSGKTRSRRCRAGFFRSPGWLRSFARDCHCGQPARGNQYSGERRRVFRNPARDRPIQGSASICHSRSAKPLSAKSSRLDSARTSTTKTNQQAAKGLSIAALFYRP